MMASPNQPSLVPHDSRELEILSAQIRLLYANANASAAITITSAAILGLLEWRVRPHSVVVGWWLFMVFVSAFRIAVAQRYWRESSGLREVWKWLTRFIFGAGLAGAGWGGAGVLLYSKAHLTSQVFLVFVLGGMMLGAAALLAPRHEAFLAFLIPSGLGPTLRLAIGGDKPHLAMALLAAIFTLATVMITGRIYRTIESSIKLRFENRDLVEDLQGEVSERRQAEQAVRRLSRRLLQAQDQERRRLAREFHDGTGQILTAMQLHIAALQGMVPKDSVRAQKSLGELTDLVKQCGVEIRTLTHLLHPPLLEEAGLGSAMRSYAEGFGQRSGIDVKVAIPEGLPRFGSDIETALFRVTQEALANIHRHSGSKTANVEVTWTEGRIRLEISDQGRGIPRSTLRSPPKEGVGIRGMKERIHLLGGELTIETNAQGTTVRAELPPMSVDA